MSSTDRTSAVAAPRLGAGAAVLSSECDGARGPGWLTQTAPFALHIVITAAPLDLGAAYDAVVHPSAGAVATFVGTTRDSHGGRPVSRLEYEAYSPMALRQLAAIAGEAWEASGRALTAVFIAHRIGHVPVAEASVVVYASSPHRGEALAAVGAMIDSLKARVPVFKREWYSDGSEPAWKANAECGGCRIAHAPASGAAAAPPSPRAEAAPGAVGAHRPADPAAGHAADLPAAGLPAVDLLGLPAARARIAQLEAQLARLQR